MADHEVRISVPPDEQAGRYANFLTVWHSPHEFTLDFSALQPVTEDNVIDAQVVSRIRISPSLIFDVLRALNENMSKYEAVFGEIKRPDIQTDTGGDGDD